MAGVNHVRIQHRSRLNAKPSDSVGQIGGKRTRGIPKKRNDGMAHDHKGMAPGFGGMVSAMLYTKSSKAGIVR